MHAVLLGAGEQDADGAARTARQIADETRGGGDDGDAGAVVDGALPQVPGIEVRGEQDDFVRAFAAADLGDDIAGRRVLADVGFDLAGSRASRRGRARRASMSASAGEMAAAGSEAPSLWRELPPWWAKRCVSVPTERMRQATAPLRCATGAQRPRLATAAP